MGVQLVDAIKGGVMVHNGSKSSFVVDAKAKQELDQTVVELKESILNKSIEAFSQRRDGVLLYQGGLCVPNIDNLRVKRLFIAYSSRSPDSHQDVP